MVDCIQAEGTHEFSEVVMMILTRMLMGIIKPPWGRINAQARDSASASDTVLVLVAMFLGNVNACAGGGGGGHLLALPVSSS